jgi:UDP-3-O-acyl-N-acetylglucosamine deacetylase
MAHNPLAISDVDNEVLREADEYLRKHKILELFEDLTTILAYK